METPESLLVRAEAPPSFSSSSLPVAVTMAAAFFSSDTSRRTMLVRPHFYRRTTFVRPSASHDVWGGRLVSAASPGRVGQDSGLGEAAHLLCIDQSGNQPHHTHSQRSPACQYGAPGHDSKPASAPPPCVLVWRSPGALHVFCLEPQEASLTADGPFRR